MPKDAIVHEHVTVFALVNFQLLPAKHSTVICSEVTAFPQNSKHDPCFA